MMRRKRKVKQERSKVLRNATCDEMASDCMKERRHCNESDGMIYFSVEAVQPLRCVVRGHK
jgi:hypothetical protein